MKRIIIFTIFLALGLSFFPSGKALALTISPAKFIFSADPGDTIETKIRVGNDLERTLTYYSSFERYTVIGGDQPVFIPEKTGLASWIETNPAELTLGPRETGYSSVIIRVPEDAQPGGHYAVIFWATASPEKKDPGVGIVTRVGALVLLEISGEIIESGQILDFKAPKKLFNYLPISFSYALKNTGTVHLRPEGEVIIKNIFAKTLDILTVNPEEYHVLPDTTRTFRTAIWGPEGGIAEIEGKGFFAELKREIAGFALGYYKANLNLEYGQKLETAQASFGFWILPWRILLLGILILAMLLLGISKGIKKYNQWVITEAKERLKNERKVKNE